MVALIADLTITIVTVFCDVFLSENEYFLPCSLFHYSYSKQSIQFVARSETNLLAITASQGKRRKIKSIFPYFNQREYSKYRK